jgi:hypothetical protein
VTLEKEVNLMVSQNAIPSKQHLGGSLPFVFSEQGFRGLSKSLVLGGYHNIFENKKPQINADKRRFVIAYPRSFAFICGFLESEKPIAKQAAAQLAQIPWGQNIPKNLPDELRSSLPGIKEIEAGLRYFLLSSGLKNHRVGYEPSVRR